MSPRDLITILLSTFLALAALYSPQPLLPFFAKTFSVSEAESASIISWSLVSMSLGPLLTGYFLQRYSPKQMYAWCLLGLACATLAFAATTSIGWMKAVRFVQGGMVSALLATTMTYIAGAPGSLRKVMGYYVGASVMGGLMGRIIAGFVSQYADWRFFFVILGVALVLCFLLSLKLEETQSDMGKGTPKSFEINQFLRVLQDPYIHRLYLVIMCAFFVMTGILNFVPFRLEELDTTIGESTISLFYLGFIAGFLVSINAPRIADFVGGTFKAAWVGMGLVLTGLSIGCIPSTGAIFFAVMLATSGFFLQHTSIATMLNKYAGKQAGNVNSLYISIYYAGGSAGSYVPGLLYISAGWLYFTGLLALFVLMSFLMALTIRVPGNAFLGN